MLLFCPNCGQRFEVPTHLEANVAHKCPSCGIEFGGEEKPDIPAAAPSSPTANVKLKFVSGGETQVGEIAPRPTRTDHGAPPLDLGKARQIQKINPEDCEVGKEVGQHGAGVLFEGKEKETGEPVMIRRLLAEGGSIADAERWATAATNLQNLRHPRVVSVFGVGLREGSPHIVSERVSGQDLAATAGGRSYSVKQAVQIAEQIVEGLTVAHGAGALHGDLKPTNIIIDPNGRARVCDFGLAPRALDAGELVTSSHVLSWLPFAAPELVKEGADRIDERADSYGLGAIIYYMLTGRPPFEASDPRALLAAVLEETPRPPSAINMKVPPGLDTIVMRTLEKNPSFRPSNAQAVGLELKKFEREESKAPARKRVAKTGGGGFLKVLLLLAVLGGLGYGGFFFYQKMQIETAVARAKAFSESAEEKKALPDGQAKAVELLRQAAEEARNTREEVRYLALYGEALLQSGDAAGAARILSEAVASRRSHPSEIQARAALPAALARTGRVDEAIAVWRELAGDDALDLVAVKSMRFGLEAGEALIDGGKAEGAVKLLEFVRTLPELMKAGVEKDPKTIEALELEGLAANAALGDALLAANRIADARTAYGAVFASEVKSEKSRERAADGLVRAVSSSDAVTLGEDEVKAIASFPQTMATYARTLLERGQTDKAQAAVAKVLEEMGDRESLPRAWAELVHGEISEAAGDLAAAKSHYDRAGRVARKLAEEGGPIEALALARSSTIHLRGGRGAVAITGFRDVARRYKVGGGAQADPMLVEAAAIALLGEGHALRLQGSPDEAATRYKEAMGFVDQGRTRLTAMACVGEVMLETRAREQVRPSFKLVADEADAGYLGTIARAMVDDITEGQLLEAATFDGGEVKKAGPHAVARAYYCAALKRELTGETEAAKALLRKCVEAAGTSSWYRFLAQQRLARD